jgi:hypothetical protein
MNITNIIQNSTFSGCYFFLCHINMFDTQVSKRCHYKVYKILNIQKGVVVINKKKFYTIWTTLIPMFLNS